MSQCQFTNHFTILSCVFTGQANWRVEEEEEEEEEEDADSHVSLYTT